MVRIFRFMQEGLALALKDNFSSSKPVLAHSLSCQNKCSSAWTWTGHRTKFDVRSLARDICTHFGLRKSHRATAASDVFCNIAPLWYYRRTDSRTATLRICRVWVDYSERRMRVQTRQLIRTLSLVHRMKMMSMKIILFFVAGNFCYWFAGISLCGSLLAVFLLYVVMGGWRFLKVIIVTLPRDIR